MPVVTVGWTLTYEVCFYLAFAGLIALPRRWALPALAAWAIAIAATYAFANVPIKEALGVPAVFPPLAPLALEFIAGCIVGWLLCRRAIVAPGILLLAGVLLFVGVGAWKRSSEDAFDNGWLRVGVFGVGSALIVYGAAARELAGAAKPPRALTFWGDASYSLYLTHGYVIQAIGLLVPASPRTDPPPVKLSLTLAILVACAAVAAVVHIAIERPLLAWARRLQQRPVAGAGGGDASARTLLTSDL
jgi:peptidoglycan/LPS O-acetylase OafA/YrhL